MFELRTGRLALREFSMTDLPAVYAYESDPEVVRYVCYGPYTKEECRQDLAFHVAQQSAAERQFFYLAVELLEEKFLIGWCGLKLSPSEEHAAEIGYAFNRQYWHQGYATEAAREVLHFGFTTLHLRHIYGACHPQNHASIQVLKKIGMQCSVRLKQNKWCRDHWRDTVLFEIGVSDIQLEAGIKKSPSR